MKHLFILIFPELCLTACNSNTTPGSNSQAAATGQQQPIKDSTSIEWLDSLHQSLPKVKQGQLVEVTWRFKNTGDKPLVITSASASCGCTVAEKPEQPVPPGEISAIKAKFDSHDREGTQRKQVFVSANVKGQPQHELSFNVDVDKDLSITNQ